LQIYCNLHIVLKKIIECIPNFCVGQDQKIINKIGKSIQSVKDVTLKCIDTGYYANRSVYTFIGELEPMFEAAYQSIKTAVELIDMRFHQGTHPRFGAIDVFPFVAVHGISTEELVPKVNQFAESIAAEFHIPTYLYEKSQEKDYRKNLAKIRKGEYEGLSSKIANPKWTPDFYPYFNEKTGAMTMGVRNILVAFNLNLETKDVEIAKRIAEDIRFSGKIINGNRIHGLCEGIKAIGWYIRDFDKVQVSMNIVDTTKTPVHIAFDTCQKIAKKYNTSITGAELIGCIPKKSLLEAGRFFSNNQLNNESELIEKAVNTMNLNEVKLFDLDKNVIDFENYPLE